MIPTTNGGRNRKPMISTRLLSITISILIMIILCQTIGGDAASPLTKPHCRSKCGDVNISYPFGFTDDAEDCYLPYLDLQCNETYNPPKVFNDDFEVLGMSLESAQMRVLMDISYDCYNSSGDSDYYSWDLSLSSVFKFSYTENIHTAIGCDTIAYIDGGGERNYTGGCISVCGDRNNIPSDGSCSGIGCCQTSIPEGFRVYSTEIGSFYNHSSILDFNNCSYSFLVEKNNYTFDRNDLTYMDKKRTFPIVWDWSISNQTCEDAKKNSDYACVSNNSHCLNSTNGDGYLCNCSLGYRGNPYLQDGCQDIDECQEPDVYFCNGTCTNTAGNYSCTCPSGTTGDPKTYGCTPIPVTRNKPPVVILVPVALCGGLFFVLVIVGAVFIFKRVKRHRKVILRKRHFLENHGLLLQHLLSSCDDSTTNTKIFTLKVIIKATNNFDDARIVGRGGHGIVYKGILSDLRVVAIKKSKVVVKSEIEEFINEVALLSQMNHKHIVKLFGCCLESEVPLLVYEFISNGTLADRLHVWDREFGLSWEERLRIAIEVAGAVAYLHFSTSKSIFHRDLKSANILLDDKLTAKVSDFGASKFVMADQSHVTTVVQGTFGYLDPEYFHTGRLTDRSDVYSFGVILVELLTGEKPNSMSGSREGRNLTTHFLWVLNEKKLFQVIEPLLVNEATVQELEVVSELAESCLRLKGEDRPTMKDVEFILSGLMKNKRKQDAADKKHGVSRN